MKINILLLAAILLGMTAPLAAAEGKKAQPPKKIEHDGLILTYDPAWQDQEAYIEANLDDDAEDEVIISFIAAYKPKKERADEERSAYFLQTRRPKEEIPIIQNYAFYQVYDRKPGGYFECVRTFSGMERPGRVKIITLDEGAAPAVFIFSPGGEHYTDLSVYRWKSGGFRLLFNSGGSEGFETDTGKGSVRIRVGSKKTYVWDASKGAFLKEEGEKALATP